MDKTQLFLLVAPVLLFSMVAHEYAHGYAALRNGDPTAYQLGRLTWNPVKHIDPFMTILLPILTFFGGGFIFGGAKPVPVNPRNYTNYKRGDIIVSLAGIVTNLAIALLFIPLIALVGLIGQQFPAANDTLFLIQLMFRYGIYINLLLAMFNLLPIPPLDGSHVAKYILPPAWALSYQRVGRYGMLVLIAMLTFGRPVLNFWLSPVWALSNAADSLLSPFFLRSQWTA
ncbi:MAG: site-2 protease family protein [Gemmatimonadaceae bacterium]|nr:site-2 protease family protein [Gemmatimonadaceae bacterium]